MKIANEETNDRNDNDLIRFDYSVTIAITPHHAEAPPLPVIEF